MGKVNIRATDDWHVHMGRGQISAVRSNRSRQIIRTKKEQLS